jgi:hypothetical protein
MEAENLTEIYVYVPDEDYSQAVQARHLRGNLYQIVSEQPADERWEFTTGDLVRCMRRRFDDGKIEMLAYRKVEDDS